METAGALQARRVQGGMGISQLKEYIKGNDLGCQGPEERKSAVVCENQSHILAAAGGVLS